MRGIQGRTIMAGKAFPAGAVRICRHAPGSGAPREDPQPARRWCGRRFVPPALLLSLALLLLPSAALALEMEFYTWGGHSAVVNAFNKLGLVFSDGGYRALFFSIIAMAIVFGGGSLFLRATAGLKASPLAWIFPILIGVTIYLGLVIPTGTLHIYDPTTNAYQAVGGVPDGIVAMAGVLNTVERGLVEIVSTAADPLGYQAQAGGIGFMGLFKAVSIPVSAADPLFDSSVEKYIHDCVAFELLRPGTTLTVEELRRDTSDFRTSFAKAASPAIYTVFHDTAAGTTMTCQESWTKLQSYFTNPANLENNIRGVCAQIGFDPAVPAQYAACRTSLQDTFGMLGVSGVTSDDFIRQAYLSRRLHEEFRSGNTSSIANYQFLVSAAGSMKAANEWLPVLRAVMTALAVGLIPFLALFIPTPMVGKALGVIAGFFIWLSSWGVTDAIVHQFIIDYANRAYEQIRSLSSGGLGMDAFYFAPEETFKVLGMFGTIRMSGLMLATVITGMLIKFGGHALASLAGSVTGQIQAAGGKAAAMTEDPSGRAQAIRSNASAIPTEALANDPRWGFQGMSTEGYVSQTWGLSGAAARIQNMETLQGQGVLTQSPGMTGMAEYARQSQAADKIVTREGILGFGTMPGQMVSSDLRADHTAVGSTGHGWQRQDNFSRDDDGNEIGTRTLTGASGQLKLSFRNGESTLDYAHVNGMSGKIGRNYQEAAIQKGAHSIASEKNWGRVWQKVEEDSLSSSEAKQFRTAVNSAATEETGRQVDDRSAFSMVKGETQRKMLEAGVSVGLGKGAKGLLQALTLGTANIDAQGSGRYILIGEDGQRVSFEANESEMQAFKENISRTRENALARALQTSEGLKYAFSLSAQDLGKEGHSYISEAMSRKTVSQSQEMDMISAYVMDLAKRRYGTTDENALQSTITDVNAQLKGGMEQQKRLDGDIQAFLEKRYEGMDSNTVLQDIRRERVAVQGSIGPLRHETGAAAVEAEAKTIDNTYLDPRTSLAAPSDQVKAKGANRRGANKLLFAVEGAFDFSSNPVKSFARDVSAFFIPQPDEPDARNFVGSPANAVDISGNNPSPEELNRPETRPKGVSTLAIKPESNFKQPTRQVVDQNLKRLKPPDPKAFSKVEQMLNKLER